MITIYPVGSYVKVKRDNADGANVSAGDIGVVIHHPDNASGRLNVEYGYITVEFDASKDIRGAYGTNKAVFSLGNLEPTWRDEDMFEDVL